ncbi:MAG: YkoF family thiamine/hydroxymethylpyrimidine-binding protein [Roseiflexaceae bacterium]|nr:thiamine-binding protein [Roseiflexus sp.]MDW8213519.1 YkoF family thiamine/hydroxymethylpyrimidine-binding protein [Roseiflexaceae bacterium]
MTREDHPVGLTAQVSLYPLRQEHLSPAIDAALALWRERGLDVQPGAMSTLIAGDEETVWEALRAAFAAAAASGETVMVVTVSNACPWVPSSQ